MIEIEKNIPISKTTSGTGSSRYPWNLMDIGDSFFVKDVKRSSISAQASTAGTIAGKKFITRSVEGGTRIWRVA